MASRLLLGGGPGKKGSADMPWYVAVGIDSAVASGIVLHSMADPKMIAYGAVQGAVGSVVGAPLGHTLGGKVLGDGSSGVVAMLTGVAGAAAVSYATGMLGVGMAPRQAAMVGALTVGLPAAYDAFMFDSSYAVPDAKQAQAPTA